MSLTLAIDEVLLARRLSRIRYGNLNETSDATWRPEHSAPQITLFRQSAAAREKTELVMIVTPTVLDDRQGGRYGYGYRSGTPAGRQLLESEF